MLKVKAVQTEWSTVSTLILFSCLLSLSLSLSLSLPPCLPHLSLYPMQHMSVPSDLIVDNVYTNKQTNKIILYFLSLSLSLVLWFPSLFFNDARKLTCN